MAFPAKLRGRSALLIALLPLVLAMSPRPGRAAGDCNRSIVTSFLVGNMSGNAIEHGLGRGFEVLARDGTGALLPNTNVILDLDRLGPLVIRPARTQSPGITVNCATKEFSRMTDVNGIARFALCFGRFDVLGSVGVTIDGTQCPTGYPARSTDIDGADGMTGLNDLSAFAGHFLMGTGVLCCDWNLDGQVALGDFGIFAVEFLSAVTREYCP